MLPNSPKISRDMVYNLNYDSVEPGMANRQRIDEDDLGWDKPALLIVFDCADINSAAYYVAKSAQNPFASHNVASVKVQESVREAFVTRVRAQFKALAAKDAQHPSFRKTLDIVRRLKAKTIVASESVAAANESPTLVCDVPQSYFGFGPSGTVSLHTFRTAREVTSLCAKDTIAFHNASIWHSNLGACYELANNLATSIIYCNCYAVPLEPIESHFKAARTHVSVVDNYHYETLKFQHVQKIIVFPIGAIIG